MAKKSKSADEGLVENDICDLDPNKICDNCCKCLEKGDTDYMNVSASFDADSMRVYFGDDEDEGEEDWLNGDLPPMDIDPALLAEWEEKLRKLELEENGGNGEAELYLKNAPQQLHGRRKRREKP